jgi:CRISPR/Cas system CMR subunit Cmr6 (Cas7 group RAMP superfamily)
MELIKMETEIIGENEIDITNESTIFAKEKRVSYPDIKEVEKEVKELRKELKEKNVSLGKTDTLKTLKDGANEYKQAVKDYNNTFNQMLVAWANKLHIGLYVGYGNDEYYKNVILPLHFKLQKFNHRGTILSKIQQIAYHTKKIKDELDNGAEFGKIWI